MHKGQPTKGIPYTVEHAHPCTSTKAEKELIVLFVGQPQVARIRSRLLNGKPAAGNVLALAGAKQNAETLDRDPTEPSNSVSIREFVGNSERLP